MLSLVVVMPLIPWSVEGLAPLSEVLQLSLSSKVLTSPLVQLTPSPDFTAKNTYSIHD